MEFNKCIKNEINGIFGNVTYVDLELAGHYYPSRHNAEERDVKTGETIVSYDETNGLPEDISMDDYFKMALLERLGGIERKLSSLGEVEISQPVTIDLSKETIMNIISILGISQIVKD